MGAIAASACVSKVPMARAIIRPAGRRARELNRPGFLDAPDIRGGLKGGSREPQGRVESRRDPVSHQCPKTRSDALDEATQTRHAKRPDHYLCDTVEQLFTHLSSLGAR